MVESLSLEFRQIKRGKPGERFTARYRDSRRQRESGLNWWRILRWAGGLVLLAIGAVLTVAPGPAIVFFLVGGGLLAKESYGVARTLDWIELKLQPAIKWIDERFHRLSSRNQKRVKTAMLISSLVGVGITLIATFR